MNIWQVQAQVYPLVWGIQSENLAFSAYLRDSRMQPSELYIPDGSGDTLATRTTTQYGHLYNGHKASVVKLELFMPYFNTDRYVIDHHNGDVYLWDRGKQQHQTVGPPGRHYPLCQWIQQRCSPKPPPTHIDLPCRTDLSPTTHQGHH